MSAAIITRQSNFGTGIGLAFVAILLVIGFVFYQNGTISFSSLFSDIKYKTVKINELKLSVRLARTSSEHVASLNNIKSIPQSQGMLFVFDEDGRYDISTTNMLFPVDLMWIDGSGTIVDAQVNVAPGLRDPVRTSKHARYVLMVNAGVMDRNDIVVRTSADLSGIR